MLSLLLFAILTFNPDRAILDGIQSLKSPTGDLIFESLSASASKPALVAIPCLHSALGGEQAHAESKALMVGGAATGATVFAIKYLTNRRRPDGQDDRFNSSFPSGHTAGAFFIACYLSEKRPKLRIPLYIWAVGVGISRVYLNRHWPSDVIVGAGIGYLFSKLTLKFEDKIVKMKLYE